jgi:membrane fusion protein, multidrug efflux system
MALQRVHAADESAPPAAEAAGSGAPVAKARTDMRWRVAALAAGIAVAGLGAHWWLVGQHEVRTDNAHVRADITHVAARVEGYVKAVAAADNARVKAGDLLFTVESADYETAAAAAAADVDEARSAAAEAAAAAAAARDDARAATAADDAAKAQAAAAENDARRYGELAEKGWYPAARLEQAEAARAATAAQRREAQAAATASRSDVARADAGATTAAAKVAAAEARLAAARLNLERTQVRAPVDGLVANRVIAQGQLVTPGMTALSIVPLERAYVIANFKETQVERMAPGQCVRLHVDAYPDLKVTGRVESLAPATGGTFSLIPQDTATGNFTKIVQRVPVRIAIDPEALATGLMRPGLAVAATVVTNTSCE